MCSVLSLMRNFVHDLFFLSVKHFDARTVGSKFFCVIAIIVTGGVLSRPNEYRGDVLRWSHLSDINIKFLGGGGTSHYINKAGGVLFATNLYKFDYYM